MYPIFKEFKILVFNDATLLAQRRKDPQKPRVNGWAREGLGPPPIARKSTSGVQQFNCSSFGRILKKTFKKYRERIFLAVSTTNTNRSLNFNFITDPEAGLLRLGLC